MSTSNRMDIPFLDLITPHEKLQDELVAVFRSALNTANFIGGPMVETFEHDFAAFCGVQHCIGVGSGTDALRFALIAAGVRPGDTVITVPNTFIATAEAITQAGAIPEFVDIDERTYNLDSEKLHEYLQLGCDIDHNTGVRISRRTRRRVAAVVPVHLYGQMCDMDPIFELADTYNMMVIEDACQAHGAEYYSRKTHSWHRAGSLGRAAAFSFYPGKNLGACGEAGAVTTNDDLIAQKTRMLRDHGQRAKYYHEIEGYNGRLDAIQAGLLQVKLPYLAHWNSQRAVAARRYNQMFEAASVPVVIPFQPSWAKPVYHLYVVQVNDRNAVQHALAAEKIGSGIHYPIPAHLQKAYQNLGYRRGDFPVCEHAAERILSLPMFPNLSSPAQERIVEEVNRVVRIGVLPRWCEGAFCGGER